jgi:hypothetical protein
MLLNVLERRLEPLWVCPVCKDDDLSTNHYLEIQEGSGFGGDVAAPVQSLSSPHRVMDDIRIATQSCQDSTGISLEADAVWACQ